MKMNRFAVVGAGFWAGYQLAAWGEIPGVRCVAICDPDRARAEKLAAARQVPAVYTDAAEMIDRERPEFLDIIAAVPAHGPLVRLAASRKLPVICQKPMSERLEECESLVALCRDARVSFAVHENWRWQAPLRRVKEVISRGAIGTPFRCRIDMISGFNVFANQPNLAREEKFIIADLGCHLFDLARSWFGDARSVYCRTSRVHPGIAGEDVATAVLAMAGATVTVNMAYAGTPLERECFPETLVFIEGDRGSIEVAPGGVVRVTTQAGTEAATVSPPVYAWANPKYAVVQSSMVACHADLVRALREGTPAETDGADNLKTMRLVFAAYESAKAGTVIGV
jgi:D-apiose dehydrogenase